MPDNDMNETAQSQSGKGIAADRGQEKSIRIRGLTSLSAIRKEIIRVYSEARLAGAVAEKIQYFRALTFILSTAAQVKKDESLEEIEARLKTLEEYRNENRID